ncbi:MAG: hypothetical protein ACR2PV_02745, partial [Gammaproteobacteria bacterium]
MSIDIIMIVVFVGVFVVLASGRVRNNQGWSAMVTPLASIIGSGFLISVPLLASSIGIWAIPAVIGLTSVAYLLGGAIRYNIRYGEERFAHHTAGEATLSLETLSHLALTAAYFISVAYYLVLLAAFALKLGQIENVILGKSIATLLLLAIAAI